MSSSKCSLKVTHNRDNHKVRRRKGFRDNRLNCDKTIAVVSADAGKHRKEGSSCSWDWTKTHGQGYKLVRDRRR